jgi:hypothetical protein
MDLRGVLNCAHEWLVRGMTDAEVDSFREALFVPSVDADARRRLEDPDARPGVTMAQLAAMNQAFQVAAG